MSVYDFNQHEQTGCQHQQTSHQQNSFHGVLANNGTNTQQHQVRYNHIDNDYLNRGGYSSTNHLDMAVQFTRPTSKTAMLVRQRRAMLEQLSCYLCKGYLIDATTISECMDSFCKSCIIKYLRTHNICPKCSQLIQDPNPLSTLHSDKVLQDIVYKLVPGLYDNEMKRRREFYKQIYGSSSTEESDEDGSSGSLNGRSSHLNGEQYGDISHPKPFYKITDSIDLSIEPQTRGENTSIYYDNRRQSIVTCFTTGNQKQLPPPVFSTVDSQQFKTYLRCPAKLTALQLKKFIAAKFNIVKEDTIHLLYLNETLKDEYSLIDIAYIYDWRGIEHMRLFYIIERDLSKMADDYLHEVRSVKTKQSVGTSTQTIKRVCIDPTPKFYQEVNNNISNRGNNNGNDSSVGRHTRSRYETANVRQNPPKTVQAPILRSSSCSTIPTTSRAQSVAMKGPSTPAKSHAISSRELAALSYGDSGDSTCRSGYVSSVRSAVDELSKLRQGDSPKETRASRRQVDEPSNPTSGIPKINISFGSLVRPSDNKSGGKGVTIGATGSHSGNEVVVRNNQRHLVPYTISNPQQRLQSIANMAGPSQSSVVTLASYTESRSSNVVAVSASSAATITSGYNNMIGARPVEPLESKDDLSWKSNSNQNQATPQLAFSFVTERGITIVRRVNNGEPTTSSSNASNSNAAIINNQPRAIASASSHLVATPAIAQTSGEQYRRESTRSHQSSQSSSSSTTTTTSQPSSTRTSTIASGHYNSSPSGSGSSGGQGGGNSPRHLTKGKPVYKTFVDPTKLKSPNFKKFGYTARH